MCTWVVLFLPLSNKAFLDLKRRNSLCKRDFLTARFFSLQQRSLSSLTLATYDFPSAERRPWGSRQPPGRDGLLQAHPQGGGGSYRSGGWNQACTFAHPGPLVYQRTLYSIYHPSWARARSSHPTGIGCKHGRTERSHSPIGELTRHDGRDAFHQWRLRDAGSSGPGECT